MSRRVMVLILLPLLPGFYACSGGSAPAPEQPDMSGFYLLNEDESDDPTQLSGMPGRPGGFGGGAGGSAWMAVRIEQTDSTLIITPVGGGQPLRLFIDGRTDSRELPNGATVTTRCSWKGGKLKVERRTAGATGGGRASRGARETITTYWLEDGGRKLHVKTLIEGGRGGPIQYTRVYDASTEGS